MSQRDSIDTTGLVVVKHTIQPDPHADFVGHYPTHVVETKHEPLPDETIGELCARLGLDEGDRIEIRFPTVDEDRQRLLAAIDAADEDARSVHPADPSLHTFDGQPEAIRDSRGALVHDPTPWPDYRDERTASR